MAEDTKKETKVTPPEETKAKPSKKEVNTAIVYDGKREVRRYTLDLHGRKFEKLAQEFAGSRNYQIETVRLEQGISCPECGHVFQP